MAGVVFPEIKKTQIMGLPNEESTCLQRACGCCNRGVSMNSRSADVRRLLAENPTSHLCLQPLEPCTHSIRVVGEEKDDGGLP